MQPTTIHQTTIQASEPPSNTRFVGPPANCPYQPHINQPQNSLGRACQLHIHTTTHQPTITQPRISINFPNHPFQKAAAEPTIIASRPHRPDRICHHEAMRADHMSRPCILTEPPSQKEPSRTPTGHLQSTARPTTLDHATDTQCTGLCVPCSLDHAGRRPLSPHPLLLSTPQ